MVAIGGSAAFAVLDGSDQVSSIHGDTLQPQLSAQGCRLQDALFQQAGRQLHRKGVAVEDLNDIRNDRAVPLCIRIQCCSHLKEGFCVQLLQFQDCSVLKPVPGCKQDAALPAQDRVEIFILLRHCVEVVNDEQGICLKGSETALVLSETPFLGVHGQIIGKFQC